MTRSRPVPVAILAAAALLVLAYPPSAVASPEPAEAPFVQLRTIAEVGMLAPLKHSIRYGAEGSRFDYLDEGGQDNLFPVFRFSAEVTLAARHTIILLYQPLNLETKVTAGRTLRFDDTTFAAGTPLDLRYGFDFWRVSYLYDFFADPDQELSLGGSLQIRNATIAFSAVDGSGRVDRRDIGPVPALKLRGRYHFDSGFWLGGEVDGIYAPVKYLNGGESDVEGAILDLSVRAGYRVVRGVDAFVNVRYLGGGAEGTGGDGFTANWLHFLTATIGFELGITDLLR